MPFSGWNKSTGLGQLGNTSLHTQDYICLQNNLMTPGNSLGISDTSTGLAFRVDIINGQVNWWTGISWVIPVYIQVVTRWATVPDKKLHRIDLIHKSHNATVPYSTMHHSEQKCAHFCSEWCIVGYETSELWDLWGWSIPIYYTCMNVREGFFFPLIEMISISWKAAYACNKITPRYTFPGGHSMKMSQNHVSSFYR